MPDDAAPCEATFQAFTGPTTLHKPEGRAATDIFMESVGVSCPLQYVNMATQQTLAIIEHRLQAEFKGKVPAPFIWRVDNPEIPLHTVPCLVLKDRTLRLNRQWIRHTTPMARPLSYLAQDTSSTYAKRSTTTHAHNAILAQAAGVVSAEAWDALLHGSVQNQFLNITSKVYKAGRKVFQKFVHSGTRTLAKVSEDLSKAFNHQKETWDVDALVSDSLDTIAEAIGTVQELTIGGAQGYYHTKHLTRYRG